MKLLLAHFSKCGAARRPSISALGHWVSSGVSCSVTTVALTFPFGTAMPDGDGLRACRDASRKQQVSGVEVYTCSILDFVMNVGSR